MSEPVKVGDVTVIVRACCGAKLDLHGGKVGVVVEVLSKTTRCKDCGHLYEGEHHKHYLKSSGAPHWWFKRIPPLGELEGEKRKEELTA